MASSPPSLRLLLWGHLLALLALAAADLCTGALGVSLWQDGGDLARQVFLHLRLPRVLAAVLAGGSLSLAGLLMQGVLRNPLAAPATLGLNHAAALGANVCLILLPWLSSCPGATALCAFAATMLAAFLMALIARRGGFSPESVVLAGMAMGALALSLTTLLQCFAQDTQLSAAIFWTFGDLGRITLGECLLLLPPALFAIAFLAWQRWPLLALEGGDGLAAALGVPFSRLRLAALAIAALITAISVSLLGVIGFVGLLGPHLSRVMLGGRRKGRPACTFLAGGCLLLLADLLSRLPGKGILLPVGALTALMGAPLFLWLLLKTSRKAPLS
ncbi:MAG: FecCD family ABC transporter permease [Oligosphaeraceae bacterium]